MHFFLKLTFHYLQVCTLKFGSWTYDKAQVDLINLSDEVELSSYVTNGEWVLKKYQIVRNEVVYPISPAIYPDVTSTHVLVFVGPYVAPKIVLYTIVVVCRTRDLFSKS